jgi:hypothetical protein
MTETNNHQQELNDNFLLWRGEVKATLAALQGEVAEVKADQKCNNRATNERIDALDRKVTNWYLKIIGTSSLVSALVNLLIAFLAKNNQ